MTTPHCFSVNYQQARQTFITAARIAGAEIDSFENSCSGVGGAGLFTDVASIGQAGAENILILISGTHGVEGFAGSGIQSGLLTSGIAEALSANARLVMIHALNPYGFAFLRRANEDNVDLNRNFIDHDKPYPDNREYDRISGLIAPRSMSAPANTWAALRLLWYRLVFGNEKLQRIVTQGQYAHPDGLFFGGHFATWSNQTLHEIARRQLAGAGRVVVIDLHTGLGPYGQGEIILSEPEQNPAYQRAVAWWGAARVKSTESGESVSSQLSGTVKLAFTRMLVGAEVTAVGLEFGTSPPLEVFKALREENWLHQQAGDNHPQAARIKQQFLKMFYPDDDLWKQNLWEQGELVVRQALAGLEDESPKVIDAISPPGS